MIAMPFFIFLMINTIMNTLYIIFKYRNKCSLSMRSKMEHIISPTIVVKYDNK